MSLIWNGSKLWLFSNKFTFVVSHDYFTFSPLSSNLSHSFPLSQLMSSSYSSVRKRESGEKLPHLSNGKYVNLPACVATYRNFSPVTVENCPHSSLSSHTLLRSHLVSPIWNKCSFLHKVLPLFPLFSCLSSCLYSATQQNFSKCGLHLLSFWWLPMFFST